ncbi:MAG: alpha-L-fucosidase [Thermoguttaceae bacterium]|jgi:alpha-L-fucosidase
MFLPHPIGRLVSFLILASLALSARAGMGADPENAALPEETQAQRDQRMAWWRDARFGMFIHWGVYAVPAGTYNGKQIPKLGEWIMNNAKIPVAEYREYAKQFNPVKYDPDKWVQIAKQAGMKYIVITSKHHDGFALFDSKASDWNVVKATPYGKDLLKPLAEACNKYGLKLGFYYSQAQDWNNPGGAAKGGHWDKAQDGSFDDYLRNVAVPQVKEILSNYGPIAVLWWDTPNNPPDMMTKERAEMLLPLLKLQPGIIWNNRLGGGYKGDTETPEQRIPATGFKNRDWETCMTINDTWGYKSYDHNWKSTETLLQNLIDIASKGGNYLLNVGPTAEGEFPPEIVQRLQEIGQWMAVNGEAIYGTSASPFRHLGFGRCTQKPGKLFLEVFSWPQGELIVPGLKNKVTKAYLLADPEKKPLEVNATDKGVSVEVPENAPSPIASVVVLEIEGQPDIEQPPMMTQADDGPISLPASEADIHGNAQYEKNDNRDNIGYWSDKNTWVSWDFILKTRGRFEVEVTFACPEGDAGSEYTVAVGKEKVGGKVEDTGDWGDFVSRKIGTINLSKPGQLTLSVRPTTMAGGAVMNLKSVKLLPIKGEN